MDTNKAAYEVPTFKVARVGNDRKRRGGALAWARGGGTRGAWGGTGGGSGAGAGVNVLGMTMSKTLLAIMLTCGIGSASIYAGKLSASGDVGTPAAEKPKIFAQDRNTNKFEGDTSNLPSNPNSIPNSMGYVTGGIDGLTPEERAKKAAEAAEAQRKADEEAKLAEANANKDNGGQPDPAALLASAQADGKQGGALAKKFGQLNTGTGGGSALMGGAGLSGGVGRSFATTSLNKPNAGTLSASRAGSKASYAGARAATASSKVKGFARQQLMNANTLSRAGAAAGKNETAAYDAAAAFDNNTGAGTAITGAGMGKGTNASGATPTPNADTGGGGGPIPQTPMCSGTQYPDPNTGACVGTTIPKSKNATPYQSLLNVAMMLMATMAVLAALALAANLMTIGFGIGEMIKKIISMAMMVIGGLLIGIGAAIVAMGDMVAGGIVAAVGVLTLAMSFITPEALGAHSLVLQAAGGLIANVAGMIGASATRKKVAAAAMD